MPKFTPKMKREADMAAVRVALEHLTPEQVKQNFRKLAYIVDDVVKEDAAPAKDESVSVRASGSMFPQKTPKYRR